MLPNFSEIVWEKVTRVEARTKKKTRDEDFASGGHKSGGVPLTGEAIRGSGGVAMEISQKPWFMTRTKF